MLSKDTRSKLGRLVQLHEYQDQWVKGDEEEWLSLQAAVAFDVNDALSLILDAQQLVVYVDADKLREELEKYDYANVHIAPRGTLDRNGCAYARGDLIGGDLKETPDAQ